LNFYEHKIHPTVYEKGESVYFLRSEKQKCEPTFF